jgi:hypothetical protein
MQRRWDISHLIEGIEKARDVLIDCVDLLEYYHQVTEFDDDDESDGDANTDEPSSLPLMRISLMERLPIPESVPAGYLNRAERLERTFAFARGGNGRPLSEFSRKAMRAYLSEPTARRWSEIWNIVLARHGKANITIEMAMRMLNGPEAYPASRINGDIRSWPVLPTCEQFVAAVEYAAMG